MGLYLAVFDDEDELDGVEVGLIGLQQFSKCDSKNENWKMGGGSQFPTLILHSDCDGNGRPSRPRLLKRTRCY